jgi:hypothetical protein
MTIQALRATALFHSALASTVAVGLGLALASAAKAEIVGDVDTAFKLIAPRRAGWPGPSALPRTNPRPPSPAARSAQ